MKEGFLITFFSNITVSSEYESMNQLFMLNFQGFPNHFTNMNKTFSPSGLGTAESKYVMPINKTINKEQSFEKNIEDGFSSDGVGNANAFIKNNNMEKTTLVLWDCPVQL